MAEIKPIEVFVSSTCYDLMDLRAEVASDLTSKGHIVRLSEDPRSAFSVDPNADSVGSCLQNVDRSDVVICIIDRRYGGILEHGEHAGKSAVHVEVQHALTLGKPIFYFIRKAAELEYMQLRDNPDYQSRWVEPYDLRSRELWLGFVRELFALPAHQERSNWYDTFENSVDLKPLIYKRLIDYFPQQMAVASADPERVVRLSFRWAGSGGDGTLRGHLSNLSEETALRLKLGVTVGERDTCRQARDGIRPGDPATLVELQIPLEPTDVPRSLFFEYQNRYRDLYRLTVPIKKQEAGVFKPAGEPSLYTGIKIGSDIQWVRIE